ncbi:MAG: translation initiation factor [Microcoleus sp.]
MVDSFLRKLKDAIVGPENENSRSSEDEDNYDRPPDSGQFGKVRPASEDPLGDPADYADSGQFANVRPASEDPYGDPAHYVADAGQFGDVLPASEDPYGDPADEEGFS